MSRATLAAAKAELYGLVANDDDTPAVAGVGAVYDHLPAYSTLSGAVSLAVFTAGQTAEFWLIGLRLFVNTGTDAKSSQDAIDALLPAIDAATNNGGYGPSAWDFNFPAGEPWFYTATCVYNVGRQDGL